MNFVLYGELSSPHDEIRNTSSDKLTGKKRNKNSRDIDTTSDEDQDEDAEITATSSSKENSNAQYSEREAGSKISKKSDSGDLEKIKSTLDTIRSDQPIDDDVISFSKRMENLDGSLDENTVRMSLKIMEQDNQIMVHDDDIHII